MGSDAPNNLPSNPPEPVSRIFPVETTVAGFSADQRPPTLPPFRHEDTPGVVAESSADQGRPTRRTRSSNPETVGETLFTVFTHGRLLGTGDVRTLKPGEKLGRYQIRGIIGEGGFSTVYEAIHIPMKRRVALKTLKAVFGNRREAVDRFMREASVLATMSGFGVVGVYDADIVDDVPLIVLEHLNLGTLRELISRQQRMSGLDVIDLLEEMANVFVRQEKLGIVHRDVKPANMALREGGEYCLMDYGLVGRTGIAARNTDQEDGFEDITRDGEIMGTPSYMAPEQAVSSKVDIRADIFSLGVTAYECLAGKCPGEDEWRNPESRDLFEMVRNRKMPDIRELRPDVPESLAEIVACMTAKELDERYASASALLHDIERLKYKSGKPRGHRKGKVFVAIEYSSRFHPVYETIHEACDHIKVEARRMDRLTFTDEIWTHMVREIENVNVVIADFSPRSWGRGPNPNVVTEAAHARAIGKPLVLITQDSPESLPFDWRGMPAISYTRSTTGMKLLRTTLTMRLQEMISLTRQKGH